MKEYDDGMAEVDRIYLSPNKHWTEKLYQRFVSWLIKIYGGRVLDPE
jgi:hypothetical protein